MNPALISYRAGLESFWEELAESEEQGNMCEMRWGNTDLQSDAQRKFCATLGGSCPLKFIWPEVT